MALFKKYDVTACFSGHFHQNVVTATSWGMPMIVTGPLSMNLYSDISDELSNGETNGIGFRVVDVGERPGEFTHKWHLLDDEEELYTVSVFKVCIRCVQSMFLLKGCLIVSYFLSTLVCNESLFETIYERSISNKA